jgi:hypothetical protein
MMYRRRTFITHGSESETRILVFEKNYRGDRLRISRKKPPWAPSDMGAFLFPEKPDRDRHA